MAVGLSAILCSTYETVVSSLYCKGARKGSDTDWDAILYCDDGSIRYAKPYWGWRFFTVELVKVIPYSISGFQPRNAGWKKRQKSAFFGEGRPLLNSLSGIAGRRAHYSTIVG